MIPRVYFMDEGGGFTTLMISNEYMDDILQAVISFAYNKGYTDGAQNNIKAD